YGQQAPYGQQGPYGQQVGSQPVPYGAVGDPSGITPGMAPPIPGSIPMRPDEERQWALLGNVGVLILGFISPLVVWLMYKDRSAFVAENMRRTLNFAILSTIIGLFTFGLWIIVFYVLAIIAGVTANRGQVYKYPFNVNWVK
ncbi:MAG: DUF4870 domain-containing protein, partial [Propionibacteriales bacterium]|nr:DUF4870 domain-containing protein [Propionibacteriales bacterium]